MAHTAHPTHMVKLEKLKKMCDHTTNPSPRVKLHYAGSEKLKNKLYHV
jgi:hypothetical protein